MKKIIKAVLLIIPFIGFSQQPIPELLLKSYKNCETQKCKASKAFKIAEHFLETDEIDRSQQWLDSTKTAHFLKEIDTTTVYIHSLQSELFYYTALYQFGEFESQKALDIAIKINDSTLISDAYFFKGINQIELEKYQEASQSLQKSKLYSPNLKKHKSLRAIIEKEHIYNNIALLKLKMIQLDSAIIYNKDAYKLALANNSKRGIPNCEQLFGIIYLAHKQLDSAKHYFNKSNASSIKSKYYDILLINQAYLMKCYTNDYSNSDIYYQNGLDIINTYPVNNTFQLDFYTIASAVFKKNGNAEKTIQLQDKIIELNNEIATKGNLYIQNISQQYLASENKLLLLKLEEFKKQKSINILQIVILSLCLLVLLLFVIIIKRKNKIQLKLLDQKSEISKDLHDDIGSGLSSILIHADLLSKQEDANENQKLLVSKISSTGKDISQRMNAFIWSLNTENNNLRNFCEYVKHYATNLYEGTPFLLEFSQNTPDADHISIDGQKRKQLFFCIKELLNNVLKHSSASKVKLSIIIKEKKQLLVIISDNGLGIVKANAFGNGLKNVEKRIADMNGNLNFIDSNGLTVELYIPL